MNLRELSEWTLRNSRKWFPPPDADRQRLTGRSAGRVWEIEHQAFGCSGEAGEIVEHVKKWHRGDITTDQLRERLEGEIPDLLTYLLNLSALLNLDPQEMLEEKQAECERRFQAGEWGGVPDTPPSDIPCWTTHEDGRCRNHVTSPPNWHVTNDAPTSPACVGAA